MLHDRIKSIFRFLFLLLLFYKEAGNAFVENTLSEQLKINIKNPGQQRPGFLFIMEKPVAIQGYEGSFHQVAAQLYYGKNTQVIPCASFRDVVKIAGNKKESDGGIMAIEKITNKVIGKLNDCASRISSLTALPMAAYKEE